MSKLTRTGGGYSVKSPKQKASPKEKEMKEVLTLREQEISVLGQEIENLTLENSRLKNELSLLHEKIVYLENYNFVEEEMLMSKIDQISDMVNGPLFKSI